MAKPKTTPRPRSFFLVNPNYDKPHFTSKPHHIHFSDYNPFDRAFAAYVDNLTDR